MWRFQLDVVDHDSRFGLIRQTSPLVDRQEKPGGEGHGCRRRDQGADEITATARPGGNGVAISELDGRVADVAKPLPRIFFEAALEQFPNARRQGCREQ